jgi:hypothetical protein
MFSGPFSFPKNLRSNVCAQKNKTTDLIAYASIDYGISLCPVSNSLSGLTPSTLSGIAIWYIFVPVFPQQFNSFLSIKRLHRYKKMCLAACREKSIKILAMLP